jgi:hypothetical protein
LRAGTLGLAVAGVQSGLSKLRPKKKRKSACLAIPSLRRLVAGCHHVSPGSDPVHVEFVVHKVIY